MKKQFLLIVLLILLSVIFGSELVKAQNNGLPVPQLQPVPILQPVPSQPGPQRKIGPDPNCPSGKCPTPPPINYNNQNNNRMSQQQIPPNGRPLYNGQQGQPMQPQNMQEGPDNILIVLDASYSMEETIGSDRKIDIAKRVVYRTVKQIPANTRVGLRVYGHKIGFMGIYPCRQTELLVPVGFNTSESIIAKLRYINPTGQTPITYSLRTAYENDFNGLNGPKRIILVSDGMETCDGDPCQLAVEMVRRGIDLKIDVVGFALKDPAAINQLKCVALSTEGKFYTADTEAELAKSLTNSMQYRKNVEGRIILNK